jgi:phenylacetate-CoA ligase
MDIYNYYFEFLKDGVHAQEGEVGEIIVTNLNNYVFPFIRYKIGDAALVTAEQCGCGNNFPLVKEIYGRNTDTIKVPNGKEISSAFISVFFRDMGRVVKQYQVIQAKRDLLIVNIVPFGLPGRNEIGKIKAEIENFTDRCMTVKIGLVDSIMCGRSGKRKVLICQKEYEGLMKCNN